MGQCHLFLESFGRASSVRGITYLIEMSDDSIPDIFMDEVVLQSLSLPDLNLVLSSPIVRGKGAAERALAQSTERAVAGVVGKLTAMHARSGGGSSLSHANSDISQMRRQGAARKAVLAQQASGQQTSAQAR
jgi:hypothetical protein